VSTGYEQVDPLISLGIVAAAALMVYVLRDTHIFSKTTWRNYRIKWLDRRDGFPSWGMTSITAI
jgi:hypothetical protein